jgi:hypothetical protein
MALRACVLSGRTSRSTRAWAARLGPAACCQVMDGLSRTLPPLFLATWTDCAASFNSAVRVTSVQFVMHTALQSSPSAACPHPVLDHVQLSSNLELSTLPVSLRSQLSHEQYSSSKAIRTQLATPLASPPSLHPTHTNCSATTSPLALTRPCQPRLITELATHKRPGQYRLPPLQPSLRLRPRYGPGARKLAG